MGCYPVSFFTIVIFLVICCQKHTPLLHSALYCLHPLHSRFIQSFLCMYWFLYVQFSRCGLYKNRCWWMQKCYRNSSTGSIFAIFSWFLYWKMCDRLATIRIWCYTYSCSRNSIDSFVGLYYYIWNDIGVSFRRSMLWRVSVFFFCFQLYYSNICSIYQLVIWFFFCFISVLLSSYVTLISLVSVCLCIFRWNNHITMFIACQWILYNFLILFCMIVIICIYINCI